MMLFIRWNGDNDDDGEVLVVQSDVAVESIDNYD